MEPKKDNRLYARVLRKCVKIIENTEQQKEYSISELADKIDKLKLAEFYLERFKRYMKVARIKEYIRFLIYLEAIKPINDGYLLNLEKFRRDEDWAQAFSDKSVILLSKIMKIEPGFVIPKILETRIHLLKNLKIPTIPNYLSELKIEETRQQEYFRWCVYIIGDSPFAAIDIKRNPYISLKDEID